METDVNRTRKLISTLSFIEPGDSLYNGVAKLVEDREDFSQAVSLLKKIIKDLQDQYKKQATDHIKTLEERDNAINYWSSQFENREASIYLLTEENKRLSKENKCLRDILKHYKISIR